MSPTSLQTELLPETITPQRTVVDTEDTPLPLPGTGDSSVSHLTPDRTTVRDTHSTEDSRNR